MFYPESSPVIYIAKFSVSNPLKAPKVRVRLDHHRMCLFPKSDLDSTDNTSEVRSAVAETMSPVSSGSTGISKSNTLPTRYLGRASIRAYKRRNNEKPKTPLARKAKIKSAPPPPEPAPPQLPIPAPTEEQRPREERTVVPAEVPVARKNCFLTTDKAYFLPDYQIQPLTSSPLRKIDVPSWELCIYKDLHKMERTEDISDAVFLQRHKKGEQDEIRRKKWDLQQLRQQNALQQLRQQNASKKMKNKQRKSKNSEKRKSQSFYPDPRNIQYIEVTKELPVLAFGHPIPLFQPCEFSLPWCCEGSSSALDVPKAKRGRPSVT